MPGQPLQKLQISGRRVGKDLAAILAFRVQERHIKFGLGHIDADEKGGMCHGNLLAKESGDLRTMPVHPYLFRLLPMAGLGYRPNWWQR
ncbi:MAG: hypothetical protein ACYDC7_02730 [Acidithiobacillus ferrivorans]